MNRKTVEVFHALMKKGWIDRREDGRIWAYADDTDVKEELEDFKAVMGIEIIPAGDRIYMIPTQDNDLFLKNNVDYRRDIKADNTVRTRDLYLMNYLSIFLLYTFFNGEGTTPETRDFITKAEFIELFSKHCESVEKSDLEEEEDPDKSDSYSDNFRQLAAAWLSKTDGEPTSQKFDQKYGILNRIMNKYRTDELFNESADGNMYPTRKLKDLMPYFLRKSRVKEIHQWLEEEDEHAANQ